MVSSRILSVMIGLCSVVCGTTGCSRSVSVNPSQSLELADPVIIGEQTSYEDGSKSLVVSSNASSLPRAKRIESPERHYSLEDEDYAREKEEGRQGCGGILSCTVDGVGFLVALPFKLVGGLLSAIF
jgi:hypothetical protein